ncbi:phage tail protein [Campylobacter jejuni]|uniref:phage tail protein n=1 Tax=Campylobacter jejuni TaxID=197 RepID=UPI000F806D45|nr:phage tail protein [Campylobacter jejuni]EDA5833275.1 phage tail protein [Campylobacter jejuni]RTJ23927.1 phage tail protein [Campylobacter jejuni]
MIFCLGEFEFEALNIDELEKNYKYGIISIDRINNHNALISVQKENESIKISGKTLPLSKDKNTYLDTLKQMATKNESYAMCSASGRYFGKFAILSINEKQSAFLEGSGFLTQSFELSLQRDFDE